MFKHLRLNHPKEHDEVQAANKEKEKREKLREQSSSTSKLTLDTFMQKVTPLGFNHPIAKRITRSVAEMIALDNQPFSVVDNTGFERLVHLLEPRYKLPSRRYFAEVAIPDIYKEVKDRVQEFLQHQEFVSCTTDLWSSVAQDSMLSLTAHCISSDFNHKSFALQSTEFNDSHTGENIANLITTCLQS